MKKAFEMTPGMPLQKFINEDFLGLCDETNVTFMTHDERPVPLVAIKLLLKKFGTRLVIIKLVYMVSTETQGVGVMLNI